jgi:hypothetical protein
MTDLSLLLVASSDPEVERRRRPALAAIVAFCLIALAGTKARSFIELQRAGNPDGVFAFLLTSGVALGIVAAFACMGHLLSERRNSGTAAIAAIGLVVAVAAVLLALFVQV